MQVLRERATEPTYTLEGMQNGATAIEVSTMNPHKINLGSELMTQQLRAHTALAPSTHGVVHNCL